VATGEECFAEIARNAYDLILLDVWLPGMDGLETLARLQEIAFRSSARGGDHFGPRDYRDRGEKPPSSARSISSRSRSPLKRYSWW